MMPHNFLLGLLEELDSKEFTRFKWYLRIDSDGKIKKAQVEEAKTREDTVDLLMQTHKAKGALKFTKRHLKKIHRNDLAEKRPDTGSGSKGPGPAKREPAKKKAQPKEVKPRISKKKNPVTNVHTSAQPALKKPVVKNCKIATKQATTSTKKKPAKKKAQLKEAKPRKPISKKMDLKTAPEGPREPHEQPHPKVLSATDKRGRKRKDPNAPKQPPSAFFLYSSELLKQIYPGLSVGGHSKILEEMWSKVSQSNKQPYEKKAQELQEKYDTDMEAYRKMSQGGDEDDDEDGDDEDDNFIVSAEHDYFGGSWLKECGKPWSKQGPKTSDLCFQHSPAIAPCPSNIFYVPPPGVRYVTPPLTGRYVTSPVKVTPMLACPSPSGIWSRGADSKSPNKTSVCSSWW